MAQDGYRREYDEEWDRGENRGRSEGAWRGERDFRGRDQDRRFMFAGDERFDRDLERDRSESRYESPRREPGGDREPAPRGLSHWQDEHYLSWRQKQMEALDRDYEEYRRERERQFHQDFDSWRRQRRGNPPPLQAGMTQTGMSREPEGTLELTTEAPAEAADPMAAATLGTTSERKGSGGR